MNEFFIGLLGAMLATNHVTAISNVVAQTTGIHVPVVNPNDPTEMAFQKLLTEDDAALAQVDRWIKEDQTFRTASPSAASVTLNGRIRQRLRPVREAYEDFLLHHPKYVQARIAYGSFLNDTGHPAEARDQWEKARELDPTDPTPYNNLADYYSHYGPVKKAFQYLTKAIQLDPREPVYFHNLADVVFVFRKDAQAFYGLKSDQQVLRKALSLYHKVLLLDPSNFVYATDIGQVYYLLKPPVVTGAKAAAAREQFEDQALAAWKQAQKLGRTDLERQGVSIHLARLCINYGRFAEARHYLAQVAVPALQTLKQRLTRNLTNKEKAATQAPKAAHPSPEGKSLKSFNHASAH